MRYRRCYRSTDLFAPFGWLMMEMVRWTVFLPFTLVGYLVRREAQRATQQTYTATAVVTASPYEWTPYWNPHTGSWEYRLASGTATATFYESSSGSTPTYRNTRSAP